MKRTTERVLALDYGSAKCGCAVSDPTGTLARPLGAIEKPTSELGISQIKDLVTREEITRVVVGLPVTLAGKRGLQAEETEKFADQLSRELDISVDLYDERFTTSLASQTVSEMSAKGAPVEFDEDSIAAAHLLTSYLEARDDND